MRQVRRARGLTQTELAVRVGVSERTVRNAEAGRLVRLDFLRFLAAALGVDVHELALDPDELRVAMQGQNRIDHVLSAIDAQTKAGDLSPFFDLASPNMRMNMPGPAEVPFTGEFRGADGFKRFLEGAMKYLQFDAPSEILDIRSGGNLVVISGVDKLRAAATGRSFSTRWMHVYEFDNGHIVRLDNWGDHSGALRAFDPRAE